jgi:hypothetical protein
MAAPIFNPRPGKVVEAEIFGRFGTFTTIDSSFSAKEFFLVLSIGRCKFRISVPVVQLLLQSVLGGHAVDFRVMQLGDRVFRFSVSSKQVGLHIYNLRSFENQDFKVFFHLWNGGGPNFHAEFRNWSSEQEAEWTQVSKKKSVCHWC